MNSQQLFFSGLALPALMLATAGMVRAGADGVTPRDPILLDGRPMTAGMTGVPVHFKATWTWTNGAKLGFVNLVDRKTGAVIKSREEAATPEISYYDLNWDHPYRLEIRNMTSYDDPWLKINFQTVPRVVAPAIVQPPVSRTVEVGSVVQFTASASGTTPGWRWYRNGVLIPGATGAALSVIAGIGDNGAEFSAEAWNTAASVRSAPATLTVLDVMASISLPPSPMRVVIGDTVEVKCIYGGTNVGLQWYLGGVPVPGADGGIFRFTAQADVTCSVTARNSRNTATASILIDAEPITVLVPPSLTVSPEDLDVLVSERVTFTASAQGTAPLHYQWLIDGVATGTNSPVLDMGSFSKEYSALVQVRVTNAAGAVESEDAILTVQQPEEPDAEVCIVDGAARFCWPDDHDGDQWCVQFTGNGVQWLPCPAPVQVTPGGMRMVEMPLEQRSFFRLARIGPH